MAVGDTPVLPQPDTSLLTVDGAGTHAARPAANTHPGGYVYFETDTGLAYRSDGTSWQQVITTVPFIDGGTP